MAMDWRDKAACLEVGTEAFFPDPNDHSAVREAKKVCSNCQVSAECLELGLREFYGIWGGTTESERKNIRRRRKRVAA